MSNPNPKCPICNHSPIQSAVCQKNNPIFSCYYALNNYVHSHYYCGNKNCKCIWIEL